MVGIDELKEAPRGFGKPGKRGQKQGSRRTVVLSDGSELKWWKGEWIFRSYREDRKASTSLQFCSQMSQPTRMVRDQEVYQTEERFAKRLVPVMGYVAYMEAIYFLKGL